VRECVELVLPEKDPFSTFDSRLDLVAVRVLGIGYSLTNQPFPVNTITKKSTFYFGQYV
jgi:hypothetical protein